MDNIGSVLAPALDDIDDAVEDLRDSQFQNFGSALGRLLYLLDEEPLAGFLLSALRSVAFDEWWDKTKNTGGSMVGSGSLDWPIDRSERIGIQLALCRSIAGGQIDSLQFCLHHCYAGMNDLDAHVCRFTEVVVDPMIRDIKRLSERRALPPILFESMGHLPESGDSTLDSMLREACRGFRDPAPVARKAAVERLWDAWERLKSIDASGNKSLSVQNLSQYAAHGTSFQSILESEARLLTEIGNDYHIRHFEQNRSAIASAELYDYLFHRMYALIHLFLFARAKE